jgi:hypothetical protein
VEDLFSMELSEANNAGDDGDDAAPSFVELEPVASLWLPLLSLILVVVC